MGTAGLGTVLAMLLFRPYTRRCCAARKTLLRFCLLMASGTQKGLETEHEGGQKPWAHSLYLEWALCPSGCPLPGGRSAPKTLRDTWAVFRNTKKGLYLATKHHRA